MGFLRAILKHWSFPSGQHLSTGVIPLRERPGEKPLRPQDALCVHHVRWVRLIPLVIGLSLPVDFLTLNISNLIGCLLLTLISDWQMGSCTLARRQTSWEGTLLSSVPWGSIILSGLSNMTLDGSMVQHSDLISSLFILNYTARSH